MAAAVAAASRSSFPLTLALLKPDVVPMRYHVAAIRDRILQRGFLVAASKEFSLTKERAQSFYAEHEVTSPR